MFLLRIWLATLVFLLSSVPFAVIRAYGVSSGEATYGTNRPAYPSNSDPGDRTADCSSTDADFYVATNGNDNWSGTLDAPNNNKSDGPFVSMDRARRAVQGMPGGKHIVRVRGGNYFLNAPLTFSDADSGNASTPVQYLQYGCEIPIISGGKKLTGWKNVSGNLWTVPLNSSSYQNFEALFYNGERRFRPRTTFKSYLRNAGPVFVSNESENCGVEVGGQWECFDRFRFNDGDFASTYHSLPLGDVEIIDFEFWTVPRMRLKSIDMANHIAYLTGSTTQDEDKHGFVNGHRYLIENVQENLTRAGQWYLDRCINPPSCSNSNGTWALSYLAKSGETPSSDEIIVPQQTQLIVATGLEYVTFQGLTFAHDNWLPPSEGLGDNQGIPDVTAALSFAASSHITLDTCTITHTQGWGVEFDGLKGTTTTTGNQVINSVLFDLGAGGIRIGHRSRSYDTEDNVAQFTLVQNSLVASAGRIQPTGIGTGIWVGNAHHNTITHNEVRDLYSGGISVGATWGILDGIGLAHDNLISYNLVYNLGQGVTSDMGAIYLVTSATTGNKVLNNVIHDVVHNWLDADGYGGHGIYFDQGTSNVLAKNNLIYRTSTAGLFNNLSDHDNDTYPQNNVFDNNVIAYSRSKVVQRGGNNPSSLTMTHNILYFSPKRFQGGHWACLDGNGKPVPCTTRFFMDNNLYWNYLGKPLTFITTDPDGGTKKDYTLSQWQAIGEDSHSKNADPKFRNPNFPNDDFTLLSGSPALDVGFVPVDYSQAGRTSTPLPEPVTPPPSFPVQPIDDSEF
jgi:hypothetical protein